ncbi:hypothetical protein HMPREF9630_00124 [Peptoanaerobacter stomatis]|uniref:PF04304 family protein n=1 Tax=Peptoanaerobacter stomatis TaxID=796937 RepID=V9HLH9_9FIRM|nr:hypothetical protein [Peptoanaerobacter stomatis]EHL18399.1 hypothetical protein HMPREF9630_00124 [Peptoanaerobacter stomatis]
MRINIKTGVFRKSLGVFFIILGIIGGMLPIMPGFIFFMTGLSLISLDFERDVRKSIRKYKCHKNRFKFLKEVVFSAFINMKKSLLSLFVQKRV